MRRFSWIGFVGLALSAIAAPSSAQAVAGSFVHFGITGGATVPVGYLSDIARTGWNAAGFATIGAPMSPWSFRLDAQVQRMSGRQFSSGTSFDVVGGSGAIAEDVVFAHRYTIRIFDATANAVYTFAPSLLRFYVIGGGGVYNTRARDSFDSENSHSTTKFGLNGGVGARFQLNGFATFVEMRYHYIVKGGSFGGDCSGSINVSRVSAVIEPGTCGQSPSLQLIPFSVGITF